MPLYSEKHIVDREISKQLAEHSVKPSSRLWFRIAQSLNIQQKQTRTNKAILITAALLLLATSAGLYETLHQLKKAVPGNFSGLSSLVKTPFPDEADNPMLVPSAVLNAPAAVTNSPSMANRETMLLAMAAPQQEMEVKNLNSDAANLSEIAVLSFPTTAIHDHSTHYASYSFEKLSAGQKTESPAGLSYIGISANLNNTWLLDRQALSSENLKYELTFGGSYGMQGGYYFANRWGIQTAWILNSWQGQNYRNLDEYGRTTSLDYSQKSISLTYLNVPLLFQYRIPFYSEILKSAYHLSFTFGGQYGRMLSYSVDGIKGEINNNQLFTRNEFATVAGIDYDLFTDQPVFYSVGIRASLGSNIFQDGVPNYFEFSQPRNFIIGLHGSVNFGFHK
jgi:hypothetical protein